MKTTFQNTWGYVWRPLMVAGLILSIFAVILLPNIRQFKSMPSPFETTESLNITNLSDITHNVAFMPQKMIQFGLSSTAFSSIAWLRLVSVSFAVLTLVMFFYILRHWYTGRIAIMGTFLLGFSSWFLHQARSAEPDILYLCGMTALLLVGMWLSERQYSRTLPLIAIISALILYIPGMWVFVVAGGLFARKEIIQRWQQTSNMLRAAGVVAFLALVAPLVYAITLRPQQLTELMGIPPHGVLTVQSALNNFIGIAEQLLIRGPDEPLKWLTGTPILDVFTIFMIILGVYTYRVGPHPVRGRALMVLGLISVVLITLNGYVTLSLLMPILYLLAASGIGLLLQQWFSVFPRNPIARNVGVVWICLALAVVGFYHADRYFVAWPHAASTNKVLEIK